MKKNGIGLLILFFVIIIFSGKPAVSQEQQKTAYNAEAMSHFIEGLFYKHEGKLDKAISEFETAVKYDSENVTFHNMLIECYLNNNDINKIIPVLERTVQLDPSNERNSRILLEIYLRILRDKDKTENHLKFMVSNFKNNSDYKVRYIEALINNDKRKKANELSKSYLTDDVLDNRSLRVLTDVYTSSDIDFGIELYKNGLKANPDNPFFFYNLGLLYERKEQSEKALEYYLDAYDLKPVDLDIIGRLSSIYFDKGEYDKIMSILSECTGIEFGDLRTALANRFISAGEDRYAMKLLDDAVRSGVIDVD